VAKSKVQIAAEHLRKAQTEAEAGDLSDAVQWCFASLEAAIDALAEPRGLPIDQKHWQRRAAASRLHAEGVLPKDLAPLHDKLNEIRKGVFYEGEDPDLEGEAIDDILSDVEVAVSVARGEASR
jgi:hypothetical protein